MCIYSLGQANKCDLRPTQNEPDCQRTYHEFSEPGEMEQGVSLTGARQPAYFSNGCKDDGLRARRPQPLVLSIRLLIRNLATRST